MATKLNFTSLVLILTIFALAACTPAATIVPTADQGAVATIVAATQTEMAKEIPAASPTIQPTAVEPTFTLLPPTAVPTQTSGPAPATFIAYIKNGNVYAWTELAGSMPLTTTQDAVKVRISGDGRLVAYLRQDPEDMFSQELWLVSINDPSNQQVLVSSQDLAALKPADPNPYIGGIGILDFAWRFDTHQLVYNTLILHEGPGFSPNHDLRMVDADTLEKTTLLENGDGGLFYLSPDGEQLALSKPESISLVNADGSNYRENVLTFPEVTTYSEYQYHPHPIWGTDSSSLRVAIPPADPLGEPLGSTGLWLIPTDGSPAVLLGNIDAIPFAWPNNAFAPNFEQVAYVMQVGIPTDNQRELHVAAPDGTNDDVYDNGESLEFKLWSPDSRYFIYEINGGDREGLYVGSPGGKPALIIPDPHMFVNIQWVDQSRIAYFLANGDQWELRITNLEGANPVLIDTVPETSPVFDVIP